MITVEAAVHTSEKEVTAEIPGGFMAELDKIRTLLDYYREHNNKHAGKYMELANKARVEGNEELSGIFVRLYLEARKLNRLFEAARKRAAGKGGEKEGKPRDAE